jgi:hypothetical protein
LHGGDSEEKKHEHHAHAQHEQAKESSSHPHHDQGHAQHKEHGHAHEKKHDEPPAPESPQAAKKNEQTRRMFSKIQYYIAEYWAWILLIIIATAIFASAVYSMVSKMV